MPDDDEFSRGQPHSLADHLAGLTADPDHHHDGDADHDHDHFPLDPRLDDRERVSLLSAGIDIGSAGTQIVFSRLELRRDADSGRFPVVARTSLYQSPVALTPYDEGARIDESALLAIVDAAYEAARLHPDAIDAGAVIVTGAALRRENAQAIASLLAEQGGEFVCAGAGHHMEATLAAFGSGAALASRDAGSRILNVDIGGGTTKLALIDRGEVRATAALSIGARLLALDADERIVRTEPALAVFADATDLRMGIGERCDAAARERLGDAMAQALFDSLSSRADDRLLLTEPLREFGALDGVMFSGGVAEFVYGRETREFGDLGHALGSALTRLLADNALPWPLLPPGECIRATALGASQFSVQLSGDTIYLTDHASLLPRTNLQVLRPDFDASGEIDADALERAIHAHFVAFDLGEGEHDVALALRWQGDASHARLAPLAQGIARGLAGPIARQRPLYIVFDADIARSVGAILREELGVTSELLVLDGIDLRDFDYIDLGRIRMPSHTVPVTIKSLVFAADPREPRYRLHRGAEQRYLSRTGNR